MSVGEMLRSWARLEPDLCEESTVNPGYWYLAGSGKSINPDIPIVDDLGIILFSVIAALEDKGWEWELSSNQTDESIALPHATNLTDESRNIGSALNINASHPQGNQTSGFANDSDAGEPTLFYHAEIFQPVMTGVVHIYGSDAASVTEALLNVYLQVLEESQQPEGAIS